MATLPFSTGSLDDIIFEGRNQAYGAFQLRRTYQRHLAWALVITVAASAALLLLLPLAWSLFSREVVAVPNEATTRKDVFSKPQNYAIPRAKPARVAAAQPAVKVTSHEVIKTTVAPDPEVKPSAESLLPPDVGTVGPATAGVTNLAGASVGSSPAAGVAGPDSASPAPAVAPAAVLTAEVMPDFVGGRSALQRYLQKHLRFPAAALAAQVSGRVFVSFVVQADGRIGDVVVLKGLGYGTEEAAARVVREMPAWTPGMQNHHSVAVRFTLPITFQYE